MRRITNRARILLILAVTLAVTAAAAGLVLSRHGAQAAAAPAPAPSALPPGSAQARADLGHLQTILNGRSMSAQGNLLVPGAKFAPGSGPIVPAGKTIKILPETFQSNGQFGTVKASVSDGTTVTLDLAMMQGHWRLYNIVLGSALTKAKVTQTGPAKAQLLADVGKNNTCPTKDEIDPNGRIRTPVILVHGFGEQASNWSDGGAASMFAKVDSVNGVWTTAFDYKPTNEDWVDNPENGPALANYIHCVAQASQAGGGTGKVVIVTFSMGGLLTRYAATTGGDIGSVAVDIGAVITIGAPNEGSMEANVMEVARRVICARNSQAQSSFCTDTTAYEGMSVLGPGIRTLGELPPSIPLHAIAGDETFVATLWGAHYNMPLFGDGVVNTWSALHKRPGWMNDTFDTVKNPLIPGDVSAWHLWLKRNLQVQQLVYKYINEYIRANQPAPATPALGGDAYWLANGGQWYVHGANLTISQGPSGLVGTDTWNAGGTIITGHAKLTFAMQPDGSLVGTFTSDAWYTQDKPQPAPSLCSNCNVYPPSTPEFLKGQTVTVTPVAPMFAKSEAGGSSPASGGLGNPYLCQVGLDATTVRNCGA